ncbi:GNAT family N-acetyltransferase [Thalassobaculum sp. OXR-137]|uniref:GNAT family N-acetyltransferase n=1 Tax=Thalassobaculum sp. OXR-137 TaxID=3100173 RepID=UPI002AC8993D|nr:GNAT family N-acetyltransferase [Thalassobaculum sp. OXR-137]WPZ36336.1 GNAT family N-acetyltransferase [Thalassobaculum sp. OXR-137]
MSDTLIVREVRPEDFERWLPLWAGYNAFYERVGPTAVPEAVTRLTWSRFFDAYEPMHALVAERAGALLGLAHIIYHRNTTMIGPTCYLQDLFTTAEARGQGVGRALIEAVYAHARAGGGERVYWQTHETNATAQRLYDGVADRPGFILYRKTL